MPTVLFIPLHDLHVQFDLPPEFTGCQFAEIIVLPVHSTVSDSLSWEERVRNLAGTLSDDFPQDVDDADLGEDTPREGLK
ncbi:MAG: hypothetical protein KDJ31_02755 [Candidatus Competibacteraceae bacterium]|nr:hypothetical protein [Candidatus Competibacteraceae bacterium]HRY14441.1 hypothetical protein [Candidatus Competibacteraceae bacterium]